MICRSMRKSRRFNKIRASLFVFASIYSFDMALPFFFHEDLSEKTLFLSFPDETSRHIVQVLRLKTGDPLEITDGKGNSARAEITEDNKKKCSCKIIAFHRHARRSESIAIAISPVKNNGRFEWFLEKATEIGVSEIIPLVCERTEKTHPRFDRMQNILVSAMLQSQQSWLPELKKPEAFENLVRSASHSQKFIAHCATEDRIPLKQAIHAGGSRIILVGPEGDFTKPEIDLSIQCHFTAVSLGDTRLRTETAGIVAATLLTSY